MFWGFMQGFVSGSRFGSQCACCEHRLSISAFGQFVGDHGSTSEGEDVYLLVPRDFLEDTPFFNPQGRAYLFNSP